MYPGGDPTPIEPKGTAGAASTDATDERVPAAVPSLAEFVSLRFATHSPFWSWLVFERLGGVLAYGFARARVRPAAVTLLGGVFGVTGAAVLGTAGDARGVAAALLLLAYSLDCADGQLARATRTTSARGAWLDVTTDAVTLAFVAAALCVALMTDRYPPLASLLIAGAFGASRMACLVTATWVRQDAGGFRLAGIASVLRRIFTASVDTPFVYVLLSVARPFPSLLVAVLLGSTQLSVVKFAVSARHHFRSMSGSTG